MIKLLSINHISNGFFECLKTLTVVGDIENNLNLAKEILDNLPPNIKIYVYCDEHDNVMGTTTLLIEQKFIHNGGKVGHIEDVGVRKEFQGLGIGTKLILKRYWIVQIQLKFFMKNVDFKGKMSV
jgi:glucosamine-phosphate N-acetyltransferase